MGCKCITQKLEDNRNEILNNPGPSCIQTIFPKTNKCKSFDVNERTFERKVLGIQKTNSNWTQVEQLGDFHLAVSGGLYDSPARFDIYNKGVVTNLNMKYPRAYHRTVYDKNITVFIFSGKINQQLQHDKKETDLEVKACEILNLNTMKFTNIQSIPIDSQSFGTSLTEKGIYIFGGRSVTMQKLDIVQIYNILSDTWQQSSAKLPFGTRISAIFSPSQQTSVVYENPFVIQELHSTLLFEKDQFTNHGGPFQGAGLVFTQPIFSHQKIFQFDAKTRLFCYDFRDATWKDLEESNE